MRSPKITALDTHVEGSHLSVTPQLSAEPPPSCTASRRSGGRHEPLGQGVCRIVYNPDEPKGKEDVNDNRPSPRRRVGGRKGRPPSGPLLPEPWRVTMACRPPPVLREEGGSPEARHVSRGGSVNIPSLRCTAYVALLVTWFVTASWSPRRLKINRCLTAEKTPP